MEKNGELRSVTVNDDLCGPEILQTGEAAEGRQVGNIFCREKGFKVGNIFCREKEGNLNTVLQDIEWRRGAPSPINRLYLLENIENANTPLTTQDEVRLVIAKLKKNKSLSQTTSMQSLSKHKALIW